MQNSAQHRCRQEYIVEDASKESSALSLKTMELQWKDYVTKLKESGTLSSALAIADVSGSMMGEPMEVGLLPHCLMLVAAGLTAHQAEECTVPVLAPVKDMHTTDVDGWQKKQERAHREHQHTPLSCADGCQTHQLII